MKWSFQIGKIFGIPLRVHITFILLLLFIGMAGSERGGILSGIYGMLTIILIFVCVILHEVGHSLVARHFNIGVKDIVLLPIGGVSQIEDIPDNPKEELQISLVGPAISLSLAVGFYLLIKMIGLEMISGPVSIYSRNFIVNLFWINLILGIFNLLPIFPMDGGRVLRSLLATKMNYIEATHIAVGIGQFFAILLFFYGIFFNWWLAMIAIFIYMGAESEEQVTIFKRSLRNIFVSNAMITKFERLSPEDDLTKVVTKACHSLQQDFPVVEEEKLVGIVTRDKLLPALQREKERVLVKDIMTSEFITTTPVEPLEKIYKKMHEGNLSLIPVLEKGKLVGLISLEQIGKYHLLCGLGKKAK